MSCEYTYNDGKDSCQCQFPKEITFFKFGDKKYCKYHLPKDSSDKSKIDIEPIIQEFDANNLDFDFTGVVFTSTVNLIREPGWNKNVFFRDNLFVQDAMIKAQFTRAVIFENVVFEKTVDFTESAFVNDIQFKLTCLGKCLFRNTVFNGITKISGKYKELDLSATPDKKVLIGPFGRNESYELPSDVFNQLEMQIVVTHGVSFQNRKFWSQTDFIDCQFDEPPDISNCEIHDDTKFDNCRFEITKSANAMRWFEILKLAMAKIGNRHQEAEFNIFEQRSRRKIFLKKSFFGKTYEFFVDKFLSYLYDKISVYGTSILRPIVILLITIAAFGWFYLDRISILCDYGASLKFSITQTLKPFSAWDLRIIEKYKLDLPIQLWALAQSIITSSCIALFFLALRWRFKRD